MAIGLGRMMGFRFPENFNWPYAARGFQDFWARWHMTLSNFMRDYLYIPLGGNKKGWWFTIRNLWIVFLLSGLWHGANWTFVLWGAWHGLFLTVDRFTGFFRKTPPFISQLATLVLVMLGWVWFRSDSVSDAMQFYQSLINWNPVDLSLTKRSWFVLFGALLFSTIPFMGHLKLEHIYESNNNKGDVFKSIGALLLLILSLGQMALSHGQPFIYFRF